MPLDLPPQVELVRPAILRVAEPWERRVNADLIAKGFPLSVRQDVVCALRKVIGAPQSIIRATKDDLNLYLGLGAAAAAQIASYNPDAPAVSISGNTGKLDNTTAGPSFTFSSVAGLGVHTHVVVLAGVQMNNSAHSIQSIAVGGANALNSSQISNGFQYCLIAIAASSAATPTIVVSMSGGNTATLASICAYGLNDVQSTSVAGFGSSIADAGNMATTVIEDGIVFGVSLNAANANALLTGLNEDFDALISGVRRIAGGHALISADATRNINFDWATFNVGCSCTAAYR